MPHRTRFTLPWILNAHVCSGSHSLAMDASRASLLPLPLLSSAVFPH